MLAVATTLTGGAGSGGGDVVNVDTGCVDLGEGTVDHQREALGGRPGGVRFLQLGAGEDESVDRFRDNTVLS